MFRCVRPWLDIENLYNGILIDILTLICKYAFGLLRLEQYICSPKNGELAQLARALAWHARGRRFDSDILHEAYFFVSFFNFQCTPIPKGWPRRN